MNTSAMIIVANLKILSAKRMPSVVSEKYTVASIPPRQDTNPSNMRTNEVIQCYDEMR